MLPVVFKSNKKFWPVVGWPDRAFTRLMSLELTERELSTSPTRKPIVTGGGLTVPFTLTSVIVTR